MRTESLFGVAMAGILLLTGCAPKLNSKVPSTQTSAAAMLSGGGRDSFGNTRKTAWSRFTSPLTNSVKRGTEKIGSIGKSTADKVPDPTNLATESKPADPAMHVSMAQMLEKAGNNDAAIDHYKQSLQIDPNNLAALLGYAHLLDNQGQFEEAIEQYELACQQNPQASGAFNDLGLCYARSQKLDESLAPLQRAIRLQPDRKLYRNNIATVLTELGRYDEAIEHFTAVHGPAVAHYNMGFLLQKRGNLQAAVEHYAKASSIDPSFAPARQQSESLAEQGYQPVAAATDGPALSAQTVPVSNRYNSYFDKNGQ